MIEFSKALGVRRTPIKGLFLIDLTVHQDARGWFKENWQRAKLLDLGLPDLGPVQNNVSFNDDVGVTRGMHAEPWEKYISVSTGSVFGAWVDLREGLEFGISFTATIDPSVAVFVPRGVANGYQTLEPDTAYTYLVNNHWHPDVSYRLVNLADPSLGIAWPISPDAAIVSDKDRRHPLLADVTPVAPAQTLVLGANGQVGRALRQVLPDADFHSRASIDLTKDNCFNEIDFSAVDTVINAAADTRVDFAESDSGRAVAWEVNSAAVGRVTNLARTHRLNLVHISSEYVFDGASPVPYAEDDHFSPLGVYAQTKAAADLVVSQWHSHYIVRTSWVIGDGANFVRTMLNLARQGVNPAVVCDQVGRLTFAEEIARGVKHLLEVKAPYGTYNLTNDGEPASWFEVARETFALAGYDPDRVSAVSSDDYYADKPDAAPRPVNSVLELGKIKKTGFVSSDWRKALREYVAGIQAYEG
jgi:dTDP-4-dehydrorhamnose 3,5-epimerase